MLVPAAMSCGGRNSGDDDRRGRGESGHAMVAPSRRGRSILCDRKGSRRRGVDACSGRLANWRAVAAPRCVARWPDRAGKNRQCKRHRQDPGTASHGNGRRRARRYCWYWRYPVACDRPVPWWSALRPRAQRVLPAPGAPRFRLRPLSTSCSMVITRKANRRCASIWRGIRAIVRRRPCCTSSPAIRSSCLAVRRRPMWCRKVSPTACWRLVISVMPAGS